MKISVTLCLFTSTYLFCALFQQQRACRGAQTSSEKPDVSVIVVSDCRTNEQAGGSGGGVSERLNDDKCISSLLWLFFPGIVLSNTREFCLKHLCSSTDVPDSICLPGLNAVWNHCCTWLKVSPDHFQSSTLTLFTSINAFFIDCQLVFKYI